LVASTYDKKKSNQSARDRCRITHPKRWRFGAWTTSVSALRRYCCKANNLQQSWRFDWESPKAVLRDVRIIVWTLGRLRSSAQADPVTGRPVLAF
jgi:hypothetical protein